MDLGHDGNFEIYLENFLPHSNEGAASPRERLKVMGVPDVNNTTSCCVFHRYTQQNKITSHNPIQSNTFTLILIKVKVTSLCMGHTGMQAMPHTFTILALKSCGSSDSRLHCLTTGTHLTGGWVVSKGSPDTMQNIKHLPLYNVQLA